MGTFEVEQIGLPKPNYEYINDGADVGRALDDILKHKIIEVDTETTGFDPYTKKIVLAQIGIPGKAYVFDVRHDTERSSVHLDQLEPVLNNKNILKLLQNAVFDMKMIKVHAGYYLENIYDTMLVEQLFNLGKIGRGARLSDIVLKYLGLVMPKEPATTFKDYNQEYKAFQKEYAANDVTILTLIRDLQMPRIISEGFENVCRLEFEFTKPMCEMELNGITINKDKWRIMMADIESDREAEFVTIQKSLTASCGKNVLFGVPVVNLDSPKQLLKALKNYGLPNLDSTGVDALKKYKDVPVVNSLLKFRKLNKLMSTYGESLLEKVHPVTGRLHTRFRQMVSTGRMSSSAPNLQNIPKKQKYRSCFVAKPGYSLITADMSGAELRILGNISEDAVFIDCYSNGIDLHTRTASEVFDTPMDRVKHAMRASAKAINFGLCLQENSSISTSYGQMDIKNAKVGSGVVHDVGQDLIIDKAYMGKKEVFEIKTQYGYTLEATADHLLKVIDVEGNYIDKKLKNIDIEIDSVCLKKASNLYSTEKPQLPIFNVKRNTNHKEFITPRLLNNEWAAFLGLFVSEGSIFKVKGREKYSTVSFGFSKEDPYFIEELDSLFKTLFSDRVSKPKNKYARYVINSVDFAEWLVDTCNIRGINKTNDIKVPSCIKKAPKKIQTVFLKWLFEGDGSIKKNGNGFSITYSSKSYKLLKDIQIMLLNMGILVSIREEARKDYPDDSYYELKLIGKESRQLFIDSIGFLTDRKKDKAINKSYKRQRVYSIPNQTKRLKKILSMYLDGYIETNDSIYDCLYNNINSTGGRLGDTGLYKLYEYDDFFKFIFENNIVTLPIVSIKSKGIKRVYDISVDNHPYFLANGFIVHNCYGLSKYGLADQLQIKEKEADRMITTYFERYSGVKSYLDGAARFAIKNGYSQTVSGRRRYYNVPPYGHPDRKKVQRSVERAAKNAGIQGANADTIKESMILVVNRLEKSGLDAKLLLTVHDEVVVEVIDSQVEEAAVLVSQALIDGFATYFHKIPMETDALSGPCWLKNSCEEEDENGKECGCTEMMFIEDEKFGTRLVCSSCGAQQD